MKGLLFNGFIALCITGVIMPISVALSWRLGAMSEVGGRHVGGKPIGRLGGLSSLLGVGFALLFQYYSDESVRLAVRECWGQIIGLTLGLIIVAAVGFWDDIRRLPATVKLVAQVIAAIVSYLFGLRISGVDLPLLEPIEFGFFGFPITIIWIVGIVNAVNLIDGLDGLAGGVIFFASIVNFASAVNSGALLSAVLMVSMAGAMLGFLLHNWHPAKIYLGDGGAYSFGFLLSISGLLAPMQKASTSIALLVPVLAAGLPIFDTFLTMLRRFLNKRGIFSPDRGHLHHILLDAGISHRRVVLGLYTVSSALASLALVMVLNRNKSIGYLLLISSVIGGMFWGVSVRDELQAALRRFVEKNARNGDKKR